MKAWQIKKIWNEIMVIGFFMFVALTWLETTKKEDLVIVAVFAVSYAAAKIKSYVEKNKKIEKGKKFRNKKFSKKNKESE